MRKTTIGVSRPLSADRLGHPWLEQLFFGYQGLGRQANPAIRASYAAPQSLPAGQTDGPAAQQALSGFEAVTLLLAGELDVRDSTGQQSRLQAGDVLWQGAGRGLLSSQAPGPALAQQDGMLSLLTLWINLPAVHKQIDPHHQYLPDAMIPVMPLPDGAGHLRLIAGEWEGQSGPAETVTPLQLWDISLQADQQVRLPVPRGWYCLLLVLSGQLRLDLWPSPVKGPQLAFLDATGDAVQLRTEEKTRLVLLSAEPLNEPLVGRDGLVANSIEQLEALEAACREGGFTQT